MALPLFLALAASVLPEIVRAVAGDRAGTVANAAADAVRNVTGTDDPEAAKQKLQTDPVAATNLRIQLAQIALDGERLRAEQEQKQRELDVSELEKRLADAKDARTSMLDLVRAGSPIGWGAPVISGIVTVGFFVTLIVVMRTEIPEGPTRDILNIIIGSLVAAFTAVTNFWIGSSQGSREKDATVRSLQAAQAQQAQTAIQGQAQQAQAAIQGIKQVATTAASNPVGAAGSRPAATRPRKPDNFDRCVAMIFEKEGGYSNHHRDQGGPTNFGITFRTYAAFLDVPPDQVTEDMVKNMKKEEANEIYRSNYWTAARCNDLPAGVDLSVFDFGVNAGVRTSIKMLQELVHVTADGSIGPITLAAVRTCDPKDLIVRFAERRLAYYRALPDFDAFGRGWTARTIAVRDEALRMADEAARAEVLAVA